MSRLVRDSMELPASPERLWAFLDDAAALGRVLPGCESIEQLGPGRFRGVVASKIGFLTVRADINASLEDQLPPSHVRLVMDGRPRILAGSFRASIPFELEPAGDDRTRVSYDVDLTVTGRLASFGQPLLRETLKRQVNELVQNLRRELDAGSPPS
jgi:carbon monoxide dehydrogenase subunit G